MARLFKHPGLEDYFVERDVADPKDVERVARDYERARVILLKNVELDYDAEFVAGIELPDEPGLKKFKSVRFARDWFEREFVEPELLERCFLGDRGRVRHFADQVRAVNGQLSALATKLFPRYRRLTDSITWRMSETVNENLHVDSYKEDLPDHHLRLFVNVDRLPRIWHTSYTLEQLLDAHLDRVDPEFVRTASPGRVLHALNRAVFGAWETAGREGAPKHIAFFDPDDVWLVDSRQIAHQIFWGRRAVSTDFAVDVATMEDPGRHYFALLERRRSKSVARGAAM